MATFPVLKQLFVLFAERSIQQLVETQINCWRNHLKAIFDICFAVIPATNGIKCGEVSGDILIFSHAP